jgi:hypothetical protein
MEDALGPSYSYWSNIKSPSELGMSDEGSIRALSNDIGGLISYVSVLVDGNSDASKTGEPLGNRFLLQTMAKCRNIMSDRSKPDSEDNPIYVPRYIYADNVPDGTIPFISSGPDGGNLKDFKGLIPGAIGNLSAFSPTGFYRAFTMGNYPDCIKIALRTKDNDNNDGVQTEYVAVADILNEISRDNMPQGNPIDGVTDACRFKDYVHPVTGEKKTKEVCEPGKNDDGFSMLFPLHPRAGQRSTGAESDSDSDTEHTPGLNHKHKDVLSSDEEARDRRALKLMRKMRRREKKMYDIQPAQPQPHTKVGGAPRNNVVMEATNDDDFGSKYDAMRFDGNTMLENGALFTAQGDANAASDYDILQLNVPDDVVSRLYYAAVSGVGLYILYRILYTKRK